MNAEHAEKFTLSAGRITAFNLPGGARKIMAYQEFREGRFDTKFMEWFFEREKERMSS